MMKKFFALCFALIAWCAAVLAQDASGLAVVAQTDHGMKCVLDGERSVLFLEGTAEEMGQAHGELLKDGIAALAKKIALVGTAYTLEKKVSFVDTIADAEKRCEPFTPGRYFREMDALAVSAGQTKRTIRQINFFPEMFHCTGIAVRGKATIDGNVRHARVLDYMRDIGMQDWATLIVFMPTETIDDKPLNAWISVSYPGFLGTVTCMNEQGLALGEMGGGGEGKWDGLSMTFLMRRIMEECATVDEALALMKSTPLTCDYYYVISDAHNDIAAVVASAETNDPVHVIRPNEDYPDWMPNKSVMPKKFEDAVYVSGRGERIETTAKRIGEHYGKIDTPTMIEMLKRPLCMKSNLHNAVFEPVTKDFYFAEAKKDTIAADEKYFKGNIPEWIQFYRDHIGK